MFDKWWHILIAVLWVAVGLLFGIWLVKAERKKFGRRRLSDWLLLPGATALGLGWIPLIIWAEITALFSPY